MMMMMMMVDDDDGEERKSSTCQPLPESNPEPATHEHCHIPQNYDTKENWLTDQHRNQRHRHVDSPSSEIAATRQPVSLSAQDINVSTIARLVSWA